MQQSKSKDFQIRATSRVACLVPEALDDLGVEPAIVGLGGHLQSKNLRCLDLAELVAKVRMISDELVDDHRLADGAVAVEQHARHAATRGTPQQVLHSANVTTLTNL